MKKPRPKQKSTKFLPVYCHDGVCLVYKTPIADRNGDQLSDADTVAVGLKPKDAGAVVTGLQIIAALGAGRLASFNSGESALLVLPEIGSDGQRLVSKVAASLRADYLNALGLSPEALAGRRLSSSDGFFLRVDESSGRANGKGRMPSVRAGGIVLGEIADRSAQQLKRAIYEAQGGAIGQGTNSGSVGKAEDNIKTQGDPKPKPAPAPTPPAQQKDGGTRPFDKYGTGAVSVSADELDRILFKVRGGETSEEDGGTSNPLPTPQPKPNTDPTFADGVLTNTGKQATDPSSRVNEGDSQVQPPPKDGGSYTTGESDGGIIKLTPREVAVIAAIRGGDPHGETPGGANGDGSISGIDPNRWIILVDPEQGGQPIDARFAFLVAPPKFVDKSPRSSALGNTIVNGAVPGSGRPFG